MIDAAESKKYVQFDTQFPKNRKLDSIHDRCNDRSCKKWMRQTTSDRPDQKSGTNDRGNYNKNNSKDKQTNI
uniref:Uncharacterized protein n=1 Tax=Romanomermis culicivorax TaxID=13658 RepID=A0A915K5B8_ROMCU